MSPEAQLAFNIIAGLAGAIGMFILRAQWDQLQELRRANAALTAKHTEIEVLVAGQYTKRDEVERLTNAIFAKLDRIEQKLDSKADKT